MKKVSFSLLWIIATTMLSFSQDTLYILHPLIGDIIDRNEKKQYALFPEVPTARFEYSYIKHEANNYLLVSRFFPDSFIHTPIDVALIRQLEKDIDSIVVARQSMQEEPATYPGSVVVKKRTNGQITNDVVNDGTMEKISDETLSNQRLEEDAERSRMVKQGSSIDNNGLLIDFSKRKRRNK